MPRDWESVCRNWIRASSDTECEKQENAEWMIRDAIKEYAPLAQRDIKVIPQGSYRNNTNVRQESDVDICVCCMNPYYTSYDFADYGAAEANNSPAEYNYSHLKKDVEAALVEKFGRSGVMRGNKAFDVHANTYRVHADVVAAFAHRRYQRKIRNPFTGTYLYPYTEPEGTQFHPDGGGAAIVNWPEQHYANGAAKNKLTGGRFKYVVRTLKNFKYEMEANGTVTQKQAANEAPSYLCECLMYNVPDFLGDTPRERIRNAIVHAFQQTKTDESCKSWLEVNRMKFLFHPTQAWTRAQANSFLLHAWQYGAF